MATKIKRNTVSNLKALASFNADFNGASAIITGRNNSGKSSFIRSLPDRLRGIKPSIVVRSGEEEGWQELELTNGVTFRWSFDTITAKGERLVMITKDEEGKEIKQSISREICQQYFPSLFDVDEFLNSLPAKQKKILEGLSGVDFTLINDRYKVAYEARTFANKKLADAKSDLKPINEQLPKEEIDLMPIQEEIAGLNLHNQQYANAAKGVQDIEKQISDQEKDIKRLEALLKDANVNLKGLEKRHADGKKWIDVPANQPKGDDVSFALNQKLQSAIDDNKLIKKNNEAMQAREDVLALDKKAKEADQEVKAIELEKVKMVQQSKMPDGFGFTDDGITYNGLPFTREQLSSSGIYIGALKLAAVGLGEVKMLHFDASFLDKNSLAEIEKWAIEEGEKTFGEPIQLLIERPDFEAGDITYELLEDIK